MKFHINHLLGFIVIAATALALRTAWAAFQDDTIAAWAPLVIAALSGAYAGWYKTSQGGIIAASVFAGFITAVSFALEAVLHSPASLFPRDRISEMYYDIPLFRAFGVMSATVMSGALGVCCGWTTLRSRNWIVENKTNLLIIGIAAFASFAIGMIAHRFGVADFVLRERFLFGTVSVGSILAIAWVCTFRSFPRKTENAE